MIEIHDTTENLDGSYTLQVTMPRDLVVLILENWLIGAVTDEANKILRTLGAPTLPDEDGFAPEADQSEEEPARQGDMGNPVDWGQSFSYPHER